MIDAPEAHVVEAARVAALATGCKRSARGVVIFQAPHDRPLAPVEIIGRGTNGPPRHFHCDGSDECDRACAQLCVHAEVDAIRDALATSVARLARANYDDDQITLSGPLHRAVLVHVKVVDGQVVAGGGPTCWQCSREVLAVGLAGVWLYQVGEIDTWHFYTADEFHRATLAHPRNKLPIIHDRRLPL